MVWINKQIRWNGQVDEKQKKIFINPSRRKEDERSNVHEIINRFYDNLSNSSTDTKPRELLVTICEVT